MKKVLILSVIAFLMVTSLHVKASLVLPPAQFINIVDDFLMDELKAYPMFADISAELPGSPIKVVAYLEQDTTSGGAAAEATSILLSASTLGILPVVSNKDLKLSYRILVNGQLLTEYSFIKNVTESDNIWLAQYDRKLDKDIVTWVKSTIPEVVSKLSNDAKVKALLDEYNFYFE
ncbi:hypothetical protein [Pseudoalteromonas byunsanensis]|uniref:DUF302 domain-containing protein n=1 Tax=Pseudoalteromonas byunsanensis TaxID=327939 RepID=A0A1S1N6M7_9GAMM|nr:hypothetical protein [Pseudoalteromonas byunsanensis]OHU95071.1 hypothetical protein BIW53_13765 [Pseudoalteromonas byunsanensis]